MMTNIDVTKLLIDRPAPYVARLRINRPDKRNAIDFDVREGMRRALIELIGDRNTRALVIGGVGGHFSAGGDLPSMTGLTEVQARARLQHIAEICQLLGKTPIPVVTAMEGVSAGACVGMALLGDEIFVGENTRILFPFMRLGLVPDWGAMWTLPRRVGVGRARRLACSADFLMGPEALRIGLADELHPDVSVMDAAVARAATLALLPQAAYARMKNRLHDPSTTLAQEMQREEDEQTQLLGSADFREGYVAFMEKRTPDFVSRSGGDE